MLSSPAIHEEIAIAEKVSAKKDVTVAELLKVSIKLKTLELKLLHNIRTNQTALMKAQGIELKKVEKDEPEKR